MLYELLDIKYAGDFHGVAIYESPHLGRGYGSGGIALPGWGIAVGVDTFCHGLDIELVRHEYGHFLQKERVGYIIFYLCIGLPSLVSAWMTRWRSSWSHQAFWTEGWANQLAKEYFGDEVRWMDARFPPREMSSSSLRWLTMLKG